MPPSAFTAAQLDEYFDYIDLPAHLRTTAADPPRDITLLRALHVYQLAAIPYENLLLHYDAARSVNLDPQALWRKVMSGRGRGGYCMENCIFFSHILRACGFDAYLTGARIRLRVDNVPGGDYVGCGMVRAQRKRNPGCGSMLTAGTGGTSSTSSPSPTGPAT
jgi:arylamine N-acetyltransferase